MKGDTFQYGGVAQLGEHLLCKQGVIGSNPFISTKGKSGYADKPARSEIRPEESENRGLHGSQKFDGFQRESRRKP